MWPSWDDFGNITWSYSRWRYPGSSSSPLSSLLSVEGEGEDLDQEQQQWYWLDSKNISYPDPDGILSPLPFIPGNREGGRRY